jgi:hypothetical protein
MVCERLEILHDGRKVELVASSWVRAGSRLTDHRLRRAPETPGPETIKSATLPIVGLTPDQFGTRLWGRK